MSNQKQNKPDPTADIRKAAMESLSSAMESLSSFKEDKEKLKSTMMVKTGSTDKSMSPEDFSDEQLKKIGEQLEELDGLKSRLTKIGNELDEN